MFQLIYLSFQANTPFDKLLTVEENLKRLMSTESELRRQKELGSRGGNGSLLGNLKVTPIVNYETALQRSKRAKKGKLE
ncbi:unnamed protein product [Cunninghamella echinulata]